MGFQISNEALTGALNATSESERWDFKSSFDPDCNAEVLEIVKDIVAMANSGGGVIIVGLNDSGSIAATNVSKLLGWDAAKITDKLFSYTGVQFHKFQITRVEKLGQELCALLIEGVR